MNLPEQKKTPFMTEKLTVIFFILLSLMVGALLVLFPWADFRNLSWSDNYFLVYAAREFGLTFLQPLAASGWFRGAISGLGVLNLFSAFWEMAHFNESVASLGGNQPNARRAGEKS